MRNTYKNKKDSQKRVFKVGVARFELTTTSTPCWYATGLRYTPNLIFSLLNFK